MLSAYPRPQFARKDWTNLNGTWDFAFDDANQGEKTSWYETFPAGKTILVPYTYETPQSTIGDTLLHPVVWYRRTLRLNAAPSGRLLLHFEGVDYLTKVWVNGKCAGTHQGGYAAFSFDITDLVQAGDNTLTLRAQDSDSCLQPRGKQRWRKENFGCWYVQTTGIWKSVWMEEVPQAYLSSVKITPDIDTGSAHFIAELAGREEGKTYSLECRASLEGVEIARGQVTLVGRNTPFSLTLSNDNVAWGLSLWSPEHPHLYDLSFTLSVDGVAGDAVSSYVGMRKIEILDGQVLLNHQPLYQRLVLDQGYWEDSHLTPPSDEAYEQDLDLILAAGYNGLRKHQKTEDRRFLYLCDKKGVLVWSEMAAQYAFADEGMQAFTAEWMEIVRQNYNHPSVIVWTPFNESWGVERILTDEAQQQFTVGIYHLTKAFDGMRPVITNDGWEHTISDIITLHDYEPSGDAFAERYDDLLALLDNELPYNLSKYAMARGYAYTGQPVLISEYGGIALKDEKGWGYGEQVTSEAAFLDRFEAITDAIAEHPEICGFCYTQITDVQQEVNGLYTMKRQPKVNIEAVRRINEKRK